MATQKRTTVAIILMAVIGLAIGLYLGVRYRPRRPVVEVSRLPAPGDEQERVAGERQQLPDRRLPTTGDREPTPSAPAVTPPPKTAPAARQSPEGKAVKRPPPKPVVRKPRPAKPLRRVAAAPPRQPLPEPRRVRQRRVAKKLAATRPPPKRIDTRRRPRVRPVPTPTRTPPVAEVMIPATTSGSAVGPAAGSRLPPAVRAQALRRAAQTVRYLERSILLDGRPATFTTYVVWERGRPRTFSFARQDRRNDLAKIVRVDEMSRRVTALVVARGELVQFTAPLDEAVTYNLALQLDPPSSEILARADELLKTGPAAPPRVAVAPPRERVAGMREAVGQVIRVDQESREIVLGGTREKTPFRVAEGIELPKVGDLISLVTVPDGRSLPRPATRITHLQPTVAGIVTMVRPLSVELRVRTRTPEGKIVEIPVPVTQDARVFIADQPGDLRALREGIYIRAYMTPEGQTRILGEREAPERIAEESRRNGGRRNQ